MIPKFDEIMLPLLRLLADGNEHCVQEYKEKLAQHFQLTDEERKKLLPISKARVFDNRVAWARTYLVKAGLAEQARRGCIKITETGKEVLKENPSRIDKQFLMKFYAFREFINKTNEISEKDNQRTTAYDVETPEEVINNQYEILNSQLKDSLKQIIQNISSTDFETLVIDLVVKIGYGSSFEEAAQHLGKSGDGGIDGVINQDPLGLDKVYLQAKRWNNTSVGAREVREFIGALSHKGAKKGIFITSNKFSKDAIEIVKNMKKDLDIILIDGDTLLDYMIKYNVGVRTYRTIDLKKIDYDYFEFES